VGTHCVAPPSSARTASRLVGGTHLVSPTFRPPRRAAPIRPSCSPDRIPVTKATFVTNVVQLEMARGYLDRLTGKLLAAAERQLPFADQLALLEPLIVDRAALIGVDAATDLEAILSEERAFHAGGPRGSDDAPPDSSAPPHIADGPLQLATMMPGYRACALAVAALDLTTAAGKVAALDASFSSKNALIFRLLRSGEKALARRHELLSELEPCRSALGQFFGQCLATDSVTRIRPARLLTYSFTGPTNQDMTLLTALLSGKLLGPDWYHAVGGVYHLRAKRDGNVTIQVDPADFFCRPQCVLDLCGHFHILFVGMGWPPTATPGFTWVTWGEFYAAHLRCCVRLLSLDEQYKWLHDSHEQFEAFLRLVGQLLVDYSSMARPAEGKQGAIASDDCDPATQLRKMQTNLEVFVEHRDQWSWQSSSSSSGASVDPEKLPRLSEEKKPTSGASAADKREASRLKREQDTRATAARKEKTTRSNDSDPKGQPPGSLANTCAWLSSKASAKPLLLKSGHVFSIKDLAAKFNTTVNAKCWEVICSGRADLNRMADCPCHNLAGHKTLTDAAHVLAGFDLAKARDEFARAPTPDEAKKLQSARGATGNKSGRGGQRQSFRRPSAQ